MCLSTDQALLELEEEHTIINKTEKIRKPGEDVLMDIEDLVSDFTFEHSNDLFETFEPQPISSFKRLFTYIITNGFVGDDLFMTKRVMLTALLSGITIHARVSFSQMSDTDFVSWIAMVHGLLGCAHALDCSEYSQRLGRNPRWWEVTFPTIIRAASTFQLLSAGRQLHSFALKMGFLQYDNNYYYKDSVSTALVAMYNRCGSFQDAKTLFHRDIIPHHSTEGWNDMIAAAYSFQGNGEEALILFYKMLQSGVKMNSCTFHIAIEIYTQLGYLEPAHANSNFLNDYAKWIETRDASDVSDAEHLDSIDIWIPSVGYREPLENWNDLLVGHARHGNDYVKTVKLFKQMLNQGVKPNQVTFHAVLYACSNSEILSEVGWKYFKSINRDHGIELDAMHFASMIELLGRQCFLSDALELLRSAPFKPTVDMWAALLTAARHKKHLELAKLAAEELYALEPEKLSNYIILLNIYKSSGMLKEARGVLDTLEKKGLRMVSPSSSIQINKQSHVFFSGDNSHLQTEEIYKKVDDLMEEVSRLGHVDGKVAFLPDVDENAQSIQKKYHSERLAIAFGLINTTDRRISLRIMQDHRICEDCHNAVRLLSMVMGRKFVVRDAGKFHHFENGKCSCGDYW
ncbi:hypothetical protein ACFE04_004036 [Oxalis oulophora]